VNREHEEYDNSMTREFKTNGTLVGKSMEGGKSEQEENLQTMKIKMHPLLQSILLLFQLDSN